MGIEEGILNLVLDDIESFEVGALKLNAGYAAGIALITPGTVILDTADPKAFIAARPLTDFVLKAPALNASVGVNEETLLDGCDNTMVWMVRREVEAAISSFISRLPRTTANIDRSSFLIARKMVWRSKVDR
jgi:hypothetical protein